MHPLLGLQVAIARTHREAIRFTRGWRHHNPDRELKVCHHAPDHGRLLPVFGPEDRNLGQHAVEELRHDSSHASEMSGTRRTLQTLRQPFLDDIRGVIPVLAPRIHIAIRRRKNHVYPCLAAQLGIPSEVSGVLGQIFGRCELGGIHINADDHYPIGPDPPPCFVYQTQMTGMQVPHGRYKADAEAPAPPLQRLTLHGLG